ncbi:uncharacterized protein TNCV_2370391 [Trichonephila clavipes]|nr:uncharacterized protein TNCV_2370391 [Trichonephila clavipes]
MGGPTPTSVLPQNWSGNEPNRTVTCMVLKATANNRHHLPLCHEEFREPRSGLCRRSGGISNNNRSGFILILIHHTREILTKSIGYYIN